ncbi:peptidase domain-containing ABC transporter [Bacillus swezeyi]|uniref:peptidase domain-containing ABC transporter n=1 Tax=Bacillus swezeyi TaxID=1925020 RepID=UPI003F8AD0FC
MKKKLPVILQRNQYDCGITCLAIVLSGSSGKKISPKKMREDQDMIGRDGTDLLLLKRIAEKYGYDFKAYRMEKLEDIKCLNKSNPLIVHWNHNHFVVVEKVGRDAVQIIDPSSGRLKVSIDEFYESYHGVSIVLTQNTETEHQGMLASLKEPSLIKKVGKYLLKDKRTLSYIIVFSFIFQGLNLVTPFLTQYIIDSFMDGNEKDLPVSMLLVFVILSIVLFFGLSFIRMLFIIKLQLKINKRLTEQFVGKIFSLPLRFFEANTAGDISTRINNIAVIREVISRLASTLMLDISLLLVFCTVMVIYSPVLSLIVFAGALIQILSTKCLLPKIEMFTKQEVHSQAGFQSQLVEVLRSMTFIKTIGEPQHMKKQLNDHFNSQLDYFSRRMNCSSLLGAVSNSINLSLPLLILVIGIWKGDAVGLTLGAIVAFSNIAGRFMTPLGSIIGSIESIKLVEEMVDRIESVLQEKDERLNTEHGAEFDPARDMITVEDVSFSYNGSDLVIQNANLSIHPGEKMTLIGKTGSGKSTLLKIIAGLYRETGGVIRYGRNRKDEVNLAHLRETIGYIVQDVSLFNDTIINNIKYFNESISKDDVIQAAKDACIHEDIMKMPMGYHTMIGENGISLSGGQRQRISIARVLAKRPKILFIDEGTSNLDKETEANILTNIYAKDITVLSITHRTEWLEFSESVYQIDHGYVKALKQKSEHLVRQTN